MYGVMLLVALLGAWLFLDHSALARPGSTDVSALWKLGLGAGAGVLVFGLDKLGERLSKTLRRMGAAFDDLLGDMTPGRALVLALLSSIGEEIFFRGFLLPWIGLIASSILFGALHLAPDKRLRLWPVLAIAMGFAFGGLYEYTNDVLAPILAHFTINYFSLSEIAARRARSLAEDDKT